MTARSLASLALLIGVRGLKIADEEQVIAADQFLADITEADQAIEEMDGPNPPKGRVHVFAKNHSFNCKKFPDFCRPPFNCNEPQYTPTADWGKGVGTWDGHVNYQKWCSLYPRYSQPITACAAGDYDQYAKLMYAEQANMSKNVLRPHMHHVQSQLCFLAGHCNNTEVSAATTLDDMYQMCDKRWGRKRWATYRDKAGPIAAALDSAQRHGLASGAVPEGAGFKQRWSARRDISVDGGIAKSWKLLSCGLGSYHCDVMYCQQNFCNDPEWKRKHGELAW